MFGEGGKLMEWIGDRGHDGDETGSAGMAVKRRYWFESMGVPIGNLILV
jgi:hypothetical protein